MLLFCSAEREMSFILDGSAGGPHLRNSHDRLGQRMTGLGVPLGHRRDLAVGFNAASSCSIVLLLVGLASPNVHGAANHRAAVEMQADQSLAHTVFPSSPQCAARRQLPLLGTASPCDRRVARCNRPHDSENAQPNANAAAEAT